MSNSASVTRKPLATTAFRGWGLDAWLWIGAIVSGAVAAWTHFSDADHVPKFVSSVVAVGFTTTVMSRTLDQVTGRLNPNAVGLFQAVTGNIPELVIGVFALMNHLEAVVLGTIAGSALNLLLFSNGAAYIAAGLRHRTLRVNTRLALPTCVMLVLMVIVLVMPAIGVRLHTAAEDHQLAVSYTVAAVLLVVFLTALPANLRSQVTAPAAEAESADGWLAGFGTSPNLMSNSAARATPSAAADTKTTQSAASGQWPLARTLVLLGVAGLLLAEEADWLTDPMADALYQLHISQGFAGLFILAVVNNLSQVAPSVRFALRGDIDTAIAINMQGTLQLVLMVAPLLVLLGPLTGATYFTLIFDPLMAFALVVSALLVIFTVLGAVANLLEGMMLIGLYAVLASLFGWN